MASSATDRVPSDPSSITGQLCSWINSTSASSIPAPIVERAKYLILDGIACGLVAAHLPWSETAANAIFSFEPPGQCTVIGYPSRKLSPLAATLLNSTFIQGFELDDFHKRAPLHSNALLIPSLLAAAESHPTSTPITGTDFLTAYITGLEIGPRVGLALHGPDLLSRGWHSGAIQGPAAVAAATCSLLGLTPQQIEWALGIACTQAGGLMSAQYGSMAKRMQHGFAARSGLLGTLLARGGYTGIEQVIERPYGGFLGCFSQGTKFEPQFVPEEIVKGLGERWEMEGVIVKIHAAMGGLHAGIECVEHLQQDHPEKFEEERLEEIEEVVVEMGKAAYEHGGWTAPDDQPLSTMGAQMSMQYVVAAQLVDREVLMAQFGEDRLDRPQLRTLMRKVRPIHNATIDDVKSKQLKTIVTVKFNDGTEVSHTLDAAKGVNPPVSNEDIVAKWRNLMNGVIDDGRRDEIERMVFGFDKVEDVRELAKLLEGDAKCPIVVGGGS